MDFAHKYYELAMPLFLEVVIMEFNISSTGRLFFVYHDYAEQLDEVYNNATKYSKIFGSNYESEVVLKVWIHEEPLREQGFSEHAIERYTTLLAKISYKWGYEMQHRVSFSVWRGSINFCPDVTGNLHVNPLSFARIMASWIIDGHLTYEQKMRMIDIVRIEFNEILIVTSSDPKYVSNRVGKDVTFSTYFQAEIRACIRFFKLYFENRNITAMPISIFVFPSRNGIQNDHDLKSIISITTNISLEYPNVISSLILDGYSCLSPVNFTNYMQLYKGELAQSNVTMGLTECLKNDIVPRNRKSVSYLEPTPDLVFVPAMAYSHSRFNDFRAIYDILNELRLDLQRDYQGTTRIVIQGDWLVATGNNIWTCFGFKTYWNILLNWALVHGFEVTTTWTEVCGNEMQKRMDCMMGRWYKQFFFNDYTIDIRDIGIDKPYLSHLKDKCVIVDLKETLKYFEFDKTLSGVTFDLTRREFKNLKSNDIARWLLLVFLKFNRIEVLYEKTYEPRLIEALIAVENQVPESIFKQYKCYMKIVYTQGDKLDVSEGLLKREIVSGIHFEMPLKSQFPAYDERGFKAKKLQIGMTFNFTGDPQLRPDVKLFITGIDYVILDVDILALLNKFNWDHVTSEGVVKPFPFPAKLYAKTKYLNTDYILGALRAWRYELIGLNRNLLVMARFKWPEISSASTKSTTGIYLKIWAYINEFSAEFRFPFFVNEAFDSINGSENSYGWWKIKNYSDMNVTNVTKKLADYFEMDTLKPNPEPEIVEDTDFFVEYVLTTAIVGSVFVIAIISAAAVRLKTQGRILSEEEVKQFRDGCRTNESKSERDACRWIFGEKYQADTYEIGKDKFDIGSSIWIGTGNFGNVYKANMPRFGGFVAVKFPKAVGTIELHSCTKTCLDEIKIMSYVGVHENILTLLGAYTREIEKGIVYIVTELCEAGSLREKLQDLRTTLEMSMTLKEDFKYELYRFCPDISCGLEHLSLKKVIHGDLSARNVLLTRGGVCKISDFGLANKLERYEQYIRKNKDDQLPWRWMSLESLQYGTFTLKSDVWSMGVVLWEIFSLGELPFAGTKYDTEFKDSVVAGMRLTKPLRASQELYDQMQKCWNDDTL